MNKMNTNNRNEQVSFFQYYNELCTRLCGNDIRKWNNYKSCLHKLEQFESNHNIKLNEITQQWVKRFKSFLGRCKNKDMNLSSSTKYSYFNKLKLCLDYAYNERLIDNNPAVNIKSFKYKYKKADTTYLTLDELRQLVNTECDNQCVKRAFLFSCLTGLNSREIKNLTWSEIKVDKDTVLVAFKKKSRLRCENPYITRHSLKLLGKRGEDNELIFQDFHSPTFNNETINVWVRKAGIDKVVTFQTARYTYISMMVKLGTDLRVLSKLIGNREFKTTSKYIELMKN